MTVGLKASREVKLRATAALISSKSRVNGKLASQFVGQVMSTMLSVPLAKARIRTFQWNFLKTCKTYKEYWRSFAVSEDIKKELKFWEQLPEGVCLPIKKPRHVIQMSTDGKQML